jgi:hypothetical protein
MIRVPQNSAADGTVRRCAFTKTVRTSHSDPTFFYLYQTRCTRSKNILQYRKASMKRRPSILALQHSLAVTDQCASRSKHAQSAPWRHAWWFFQPVLQLCILVLSIHLGSAETRKCGFVLCNVPTSSLQMMQQKLQFTIGEMLTLEIFEAFFIKIASSSLILLLKASIPELHTLFVNFLETTIGNS